MSRPTEPGTLLAGLNVDALLVTAPANVRYLSDFTSPSDGRVLITPERSWLITDSRYLAQSREESRLPLEVRRDWLQWSAERVRGGRLGVEAESLTLAQYQELSELLPDAVVGLRDVLGRHRVTKDADELANLKKAAQLTDEAFTHILGFLRPGLTEIEVALELERVIRGNGAEAISFDTVVASGVRSAMPHGVASPKRIERGDLVTLDFGAKVNGYHADMTRAVAIGPISERLRTMYEAVLEAELASLECVRPGASGRELDALARRVLENHGLEQHFAHSLGHGVGLEVHEAPKLSANSQDVLAPGMTVTIEPGVYIPDFGGVRIEDLVLVSETGHQRLSLSPKELIVV